MIPTRSASWSASSRYCVVRKIVAPSSFSAWTSSQIALRLTGSRPVVGSSRKRTRGWWTSADARSSRRLHPARVRADAAVRGVVDVNPVEQRVGALLALGA